MKSTWVSHTHIHANTYCIYIFEWVYIRCRNTITSLLPLNYCEMSDKTSEQFMCQRNAVQQTQSALCYCILTTLCLSCYYTRATVYYIDKRMQPFVCYAFELTMMIIHRFTIFVLLSLTRMDFQIQTRIQTHFYSLILVHAPYWLSLNFRLNFMLPTVKNIWQ